MLRNEEIIYVANDWFKENKTSAHHIAEELARHNRMLYVEAAGMRAPRASKRDFRKILTKFQKLFARPVKKQENFYLYSPFVIPFHRYGIVRRLNRILMRIMLKRACRHVGFENPILWIFMPHYSAALDTIRCKGVVYYCVDQYAAQPNVDSEMIEMMEREILSRADIVFAVSENLVEDKSRLNPQTYLSRHGVDVEFFATALDDATRIPDDIASIPRPIAGFFGLIEKWIDLDMADYLATNLPEVSFVWIGRVARDVEYLKRHPNVYFLGQRDYDTLPAYLKAFDVGLLPYEADTQVIFSNPKKLREYLAGGKPVVSIPVREVDQYKNVVYVSEGYEEFAANIRRAIGEDSPQRRSERLEAVRLDSWTARVSRLSDLIGKHIPVVSNEYVKSGFEAHARAFARRYCR